MVERFAPVQLAGGQRGVGGRRVDGLVAQVVGAARGLRRRHIAQVAVVDVGLDLLRKAGVGGLEVLVRLLGEGAVGGDHFGHLALQLRLDVEDAVGRDLGRRHVLGDAVGHLHAGCVHRVQRVDAAGENGVESSETQDGKDFGHWELPCSSNRQSVRSATNLTHIAKTVKGLYQYLPKYSKIRLKT